jgi:UDP-N-acetylglucosamine--N-acetylmuramyl-(pentapeptide) pyrophosphoryl-undecaprenol N-acetylglucosamine transferase
MEHALSVSTLAVSRAGALMLSELCAWGVPALLIPLPHAAADHQRKNARTLASSGAAHVFEESAMRASPADLWRELVRLLCVEGELAGMAKAARQRGNPRAADEIAADLWRLMEAA